MIYLAQNTSSGSWATLLIFLLPLGLLFLFMRSQQRRARQQQSLQQSAEVGDEILTTSGIYGTIVDEDEDEGTVTVEISPGTRIKMVRAGIARRITQDDVDDDDDTGDEETHDAGDEPDENAEGPIRS